MKELLRNIKTSPLFFAFVLLFCFSLLFSKLYLLENNRNSEKVTLYELKGECYKLSWNGDCDFVFSCVDGENNEYRILVKGSYLSDDERQSILDTGFCYATYLKVVKPEVSGNEGEFDYAEYLKAKKIDYYVYASAGGLKTTSSWENHSVTYYSSMLRGIFYESLSKYFDQDFSSMIMAIMTGDTGMMDKSEKESISLSGFSHLIAVSGAHLVFFSKPFAIILKRTTFSAGKRKIILLVPVFFLWFMAGGSPSVTRAMIMTVVASLGTALKKPSNLKNNIGIAGIIQLAFNPFSCLDTGFLLSYGATISLAFIMPRLKDILKTKNTIVNLFIPGLAVNLGILPISLSIFGSFSICGFLLNVLAGEICGAICVGGYLVVFLDLLLSFLPIKQGAAILTSLAFVFEKISSFISNRDSWFFRIQVSAIPVIIIIAYYLIMFFVLSEKHPKILIGLISVIMLFVIVQRVTTKITVSFFDVGQGSSQLIRTCDGINVLVDTGDGNTDVSELLLREGVKKLDFLIITHGHDDHYGGLSGVLENIEVKQIIIPSNSFDSYCNGLEATYNVPITRIYNEKSYHLGKYSVISLFESSFDNSDLNRGSIVIKLSGDWGGVVLPGDGDSVLMDELLGKNIDFSANVYLAAHHGSESSVNEKFLCDVSPKYAIISAGYKNTYGHPHEAFLEALSSLSIKDENIYRTDSDGEIKVSLGIDVFGKDFVRVWQKKLRLT